MITLPLIKGTFRWQIHYLYVAMTSLVKANFKEEKLLNTLPLNKITFIW